MMPSGLYRSNITAVGVSDGPWYDWNLRGKLKEEANAPVGVFFDSPSSFHMSFNIQTRGSLIAYR
jgi:hypothetical protein